MGYSKNQNVGELGQKDSVESIFLVKYIAVREARDGKSYLNLILADSTGDLEARKWNGAEKVMGLISRGDFVGIKGKVNLFQGRLQVIVQDIEKVEVEEADKELYRPKSSSKPEEMYAELLELVDQLDDVYIKELLERVLRDAEISKRLKIWQAGKSIHHAYQSGLLEHILSCSKLSMIMSEHYKTNKNYVLAGAILHDLGKIYELSSGDVVEYTMEGKLIGHLVKILEVVDFYCSKIKNFPYGTKTHLKHILLSHHGEYAYGSPKIPATSEAYLVHFIDHLDSKMNSFETIKKNDTNPGGWSNFVKHLDRIVFKDELPHYTEFIDNGETLEKSKREVTDNKAQSKANYSEKVANPTMSNLLKGIKIE